MCVAEGLLKSVLFREVLLDVVVEMDGYAREDMVPFFYFNFLGSHFPCTRSFRSVAITNFSKHQKSSPEEDVIILIG